MIPEEVSEANRSGVESEAMLELRYCLERIGIAVDRRHRQLRSDSGGYSRRRSGQPSSYDQLAVGGTTTLSGTLNLTLEPGFDAAVGTVFDIAALTGAVRGNFSTFNNQTFDSGTRTFVELISGQQVDLDVVSTSPTAPEPSTLGMMLCAMLVGGGITWRVRRRSTKVIR